MGFAAEIKEFLGAAKDSWKLATDTESKDATTAYTKMKTLAEQKEMDDPLNQKLKEAKLAHLTATTGNIGRETPLQALQRKALQLEMDARANPPPYGPAVTANPNTNYGGKAAAQEYDPNDTPGVGGGFSTRTYPSQTGYGGSHAKGGLVRKFAVGGVVDDEDLADEDTSGVTGPAIGAGPPMPRATDFSAQRRTTPGAVPLPQARPPNAVDDALKYGATQIQQLPAIGSARQRAIRGYAQGAGGAPPDDMIQVYRKIDPKGEMGESERNLQALQAVWQFKHNQGDAEGAAKAAFQMLQTYKVASTRYAALAAAAMKDGHVDDGMKLALKAYANVPDGNNMRLYKGKDGSLNWEISGTDENGNPTKKAGGIATPDEIGSAAARLATPGGFENHLVQMTSGAKIGGRTIGAGGGAGGKKEEEDVEGAAGGGFKTSKPTEYKELKQEQIDTSVDNWLAAQAKDPANKGKEPPTPKEIAQTKNMLFHLRANNQITDDEGLRRLQTIVTAEEPIRKGDPLPFRAVENKEAKTHTIMFPDGGELIVPNNQLGQFRSARHDYFAEQAKKAKAAAEAADRPDFMTRAWEGTKKVIGKEVDELGERAESVIKENPEFAARAGSAVRDIKHVANEAYEYGKKFLGAAPGASLVGGTGYEGPGDVYGGVNKAVGAVADTVGPAIGRAAAAVRKANEPRFYGDEEDQTK